MAAMSNRVSKYKKGSKEYKAAHAKMKMLKWKLAHAKKKKVVKKVVKKKGGKRGPNTPFQRVDPSEVHSGVLSPDMQQGCGALA